MLSAGGVTVTSAGGVDAWLARRRPSAGVPEFELVLVDGDNLLHRVRGMRDEAGLRWLLPRLRAWRPPNATITVMLDGHPDPGEARRRRVATGVEFRHSGDVDGDSGDGRDARAPGRTPIARARSWSPTIANSAIACDTPAGWSDGSTGW